MYSKTCGLYNNKYTDKVNSDEVGGAPHTGNPLRNNIPGEA